MFRRKEDSLFDNTTDPNQKSTESGSKSPSESSGSSSAPSAASPAPGSYQNSNSPTPSTGYGQSMPRPPSAAQPSSSSAFRSNASAPISSDMGRNRMPESNKPQSTTSSGPIPAPMSTADNKPSGAPKKTGNRVLTVGNDILLKGEIATCDRLVIEGKVDATLNDVHTVEISEQGSFKGSANIENAEISGLFEGDLVVRKRLVIYATGKVRGSITYGEIEVERGGEISGDIKTDVSGASSAASSSSSRSRQKSKEAA